MRCEVCVHSRDSIIEHDPRTTWPILEDLSWPELDDIEKSDNLTGFTSEERVLMKILSELV